MPRGEATYLALAQPGEQDQSMGDQVPSLAILDPPSSALACTEGASILDLAADAVVVVGLGWWCPLPRW